jgi:hypothetical protein
MALLQSYTKGGSDSEIALALHAFCLFAFTVETRAGVNDNCRFLFDIPHGIFPLIASLFAELREKLTTTLTTGVGVPLVREEAALCLSALAFVAHDDDEEGLKEVLVVLMKQFTSSLSSSLGASNGDDFDDDESQSSAAAAVHSDPEESDDGLGKHADDATVLATCLASWTGLLPLSPPKYVVETLLPSSLSALHSLLANSRLTVRASAGEAIALLFLIAREFYGDDFDIHMFDDVVDADELSHLLRDLSNENDRHTTKKERVEQRKIFKTYSNIFETGLFQQNLPCF